MNLILKKYYIDLEVGYHIWKWTSRATLTSPLRWYPSENSVRNSLGLGNTKYYSPYFRLWGWSPFEKYLPRLLEVSSYITLICMHFRPRGDCRSLKLFLSAYLSSLAIRFFVFLSSQFISLPWVTSESCQSVAWETRAMSRSSPRFTFLVSTHLGITLWHSLWPLSENYLMYFPRF